ncbi:GNAT family N-acetyltransferase, partial [Paraburkholderia sp. BR10937]|uniref:GNAT family N-acetyltransferase n=1 Tax=Paraburkholderia sp. BR10937 TaxID=3236994 RepID=UPI0034D337A4
YRPLAVSVSHPETGEIVAGLLAGTNYGQLHVLVLFVQEELRGAGIGSRLMLLAEEEACRRGCSGAWLDTYSFQARAFYERLDYTVFGTIDNYPPGHSRFFMKKPLLLQDRQQPESRQ